jgi:rubredoxin
MEDLVMKKYKCLICDYIYDPAVGDPDHGASPGTAFESLPANWTCPDCGASKSDFEAIE